MWDTVKSFRKVYKKNIITPILFAQVFLYYWLQVEYIIYCGKTLVITSLLFLNQIIYMEPFEKSV